MAADAKGAITKPHVDAVVAQVPRDGLRSLFHLLVGRPDTQHKLLKRPCQVTPQELYDLNERVMEKLANHHVDGVVAASAEIVFADKSAVQFGTWVEFERFRWSTPKVTRELRLTWNFLLKTEGFDIPQKHSMTLKLSAEGRPIELLQAILASPPDELSVDTVESTPMVCRVDFISHVIGQELINIVEEWNKGLPSPDSDESWLHSIEFSGTRIARIVHYSTPVLLALLCVASLRYLSADLAQASLMTVGTAVLLMQWLFISLMVLYVGEKLSGWLASKCYKALHSYGRFQLFHLTNGDKDAAKTLRQKNEKHVRGFLMHAFTSLLLNLGSAWLAFLLWE